MPKALDVEKQRFNFGDPWTVAFKYDDEDYYRRKGGIQGLNGHVDGEKESTKAMDVVALRETFGLLLLEAKDFRGHRIKNKPRIVNGEVILEVALKVRDTIAGLVGAARSEETGFPSAAVFALLPPGEKVTVVLWIEDDVQSDVFRAKQQMHTLNELLKAKLAWLNVKTFVLSSRVPNKLRDLTVTNLPGAGQPNP